MNRSVARDFIRVNLGFVSPDIFGYGIRDDLRVADDIDELVSATLRVVFILVRHRVRTTEVGFADIREQYRMFGPLELV